MAAVRRPHVLGIDDGPFDKVRDADVPVVAVLNEGPDLTEAVSVTRFAVDGDDATGFLGQWVAAQRYASGIHAIVTGGITIAGLGVIDVRRLAERLRLPVAAVNRRRPRDEPLLAALGAAGLGSRRETVLGSPKPWRLDDGLWVAHAGAERETVVELLDGCRGKSNLPEPLRLAHLIAGAVATGDSRSRP